VLKRHTPGFLKTVGIVTPDPPEIPPEIRMQMQLPPQPPPEFQELKAVLGQDYTVSDVSLATAGGVPTNVDILLVVKPTNLDEKQLYNLDQYLMRGGRVVLCTGNYDVNFGAGLSVAPIESGLGEWLAHHGVTVDSTLILDDRNQQLPLPEVRNTPFGQMRTWTLAPYPYLVQVREDGFLNPEITATLGAVGIYWGSPLTFDETAAPDLEMIPILQSSQRSWTDTDVSAVAYVDYEVPAEGTEPHLLAAALNGRFKSYFEQPPGGGDEGAVDEQNGEDSAEDGAVVLGTSPETRLVVIGNAEFLSDFVARALSQIDGGFFVENLRFLQNTIDWVGLDNDMLSIRARGAASRRLYTTGRSTEMMVEAVSYALPILSLLGFGAYLHWRRRRTRPLSLPTGGGVATTGVTRTEV
jgi:ABC-2 type transport system permease protein